MLGLGDGEVWNYVVVRLATDYRSELRLADEQVTGDRASCPARHVERHVALELRAASDGRVAAETECVFAAWDRRRGPRGR